MTRPRLATSLAALVLAASLVEAAPPATPPIERSPEFVASVHGAIERGVAWLKRAAATGSFPQIAAYPGAIPAFAYHALRVCGTPRDDGAAGELWNCVRTSAPRADPPTYVAAACLLALSEHGRRDPAAADDHDTTLDRDDATWATDLVRGLAETRFPNGGWSYGAGEKGVEDHSNTQYALLGLKAAARCGIAVDSSVWVGTLVHLCEVQEEAGPAVPRKGPGFFVDHARSWDYRDVEERSNGTLSMTAGCVGSLVICRSEALGTPTMTAKLAKRSERAIRDGVAWIGSRWAPSATPGEADLYAAYAVERAGVLAAVDWMGELDWYGRGAEALVAAQNADGSWDSPITGLLVDPKKDKPTARARRVANTCFALLFLARGTTPVHRGAVTEQDPFGLDFDAAARATGRDFDEVVDVVLGKSLRVDDADERRRLANCATAIGPKIVEPLIARLASPNADRRAAAAALLRHATGLDFDYDATGDVEKREEATAKWTKWFIDSKEKLVYDRALKRIVVAK